MPRHAARLTIDLAALQENWRLLDARAAPGVSGAVVKADAYGLGIEVAVPALWQAGCRTFFVAHISEAVRAREAAPEAEIFVLNGLCDDLSAYAAHHLAPVIGTRAEAADYAAFRATTNAPSPALHIDTGMNRLGMALQDGLDFLRAGGFQTLAPGLVMTHFVSAEIPGDAETTAQIEGFNQVADAIQRLHGLNPKPRLSLCNSSGLFVEAAPRHALSRPGYALYGGNPTPDAPNPMRSVITLEAPIIQIHAVPKGARVGYNSNFIATRESRIATLSCGYADGYPRNAGARPGAPGGRAKLAGRIVPFAGNVSMDLITLDITDVPVDAVKPGDMALLIGEELSVDAVGLAAKTTGYEILTNLGKRYERRVIGG